MAVRDTFLLERYVARTSVGGSAASAARARAAAAAMRREGRQIRILRSFFMPDDELWFCLYEAASLDDVTEASRRAGLAGGRIQQAHDDDSRPGSKTIWKEKR